MERTLTMNGSAEVNVTSHGSQVKAISYYNAPRINQSLRRVTIQSRYQTPTMISPEDMTATLGCML